MSLPYEILTPGSPGSLPAGQQNASARIAVDVAITLSDVQTLQSTALIAGDLVLVTAQSDGRLNGLYRVVKAGAWARVFNLFAGMIVTIKDGTHKNSAWHLAVQGNIVIGTTDLVFVKLGGATRWTSISGWTAAPLTTNTISVASSTGRVAGEPIRYTTEATGSTFFYGIIVATTINSLIIAGPSLTGIVITGIWVGNLELVTMVQFCISSLFAVTSQDILAAVAKQFFIWRFGPAALVMFTGVAADKGLGTAKINVKIGGLIVDSAGVILTTSAVAVNSASIIRNNYMIAFGQAMEIACQATDAKATDLSVIAVLILV